MLLLSVFCLFYLCFVFCFFFFKQKTAYEMRISDWSSDVCSSDLESGRADTWRAGGLSGLRTALVGAGRADAVASGIGSSRTGARDPKKSRGVLRGDTIARYAWIQAPDRKSTRLNSSH